MRILGAVLVLVLTASAGGAATTSITDVLSGDTVVTNEGVKLYLEGIEAPEMPRGQLEGQPFAEEARNLLLRLMEGQSVSIDIVFRDSEGRLYAIIIAPAGNVAAILAANGLAYPGVNCDRFNRRELDACFRDAQNRHVGIWGLERYEPARAYRARYRMGRL